LRHVQRLAHNRALYLPSNPNNKEQYRAREQQLRKTTHATAQQRRHTHHRFRIARDKLHERIVERKQQQPAIENVVDARQIAILLLVKHHEAVVLFDEVVVSPQRRHEEEDESKASQHQRWSNCEKEQRAPEQPRAIFSFGAIEISAREGAKDVWGIDQYGPGSDHRYERNEPAHVKNQQRVTRNDRADKPDHIIARTDNPAQRDRARDRLTDDFSTRSHCSRFILAAK